MTDPDSSVPAAGLPDPVRQVVRTWAQAFWGAALTALFAWLSSKWGLEVPTDLADGLSAALTAVVVAFVAVAWLVVVRALSKRFRGLQWLSRAFILPGTPVYSGTREDDSSPGTSPGA